MVSGGKKGPTDFGEFFLMFLDVLSTISYDPDVLAQLWGKHSPVMELYFGVEELRNKDKSQSLVRYFL